MTTIEPVDVKSQSDSVPFFPSPVGGLIVYRTFQQKLKCVTPHRPFLKAICHSSKQVVLFRPACKMWKCPACATQNAKKAVFRALHGTEVLIAGGADIDFLTVTSHEKLDAAGSWAVLPKAWNKLNTRVKREVSDPQYFAVPEQHKNGRWHLHAITTARLPKKWWKDNARACGLGYQSDVKEVKSLGGVASYVGKYLTKTLQDFPLPSGANHTRVSHGWPDLPELPQLEGWQFMAVPRDIPIKHETDSYQRLGYTVVLADEKSSWDWMALWS